ncbi:SDR family NAD(P)-dependent oxidoreductase [Roseofilum capinflatum]|uniref:3-oxoacyl-ACP reductase FabG n=1 Tax=Roseofilum capinflatum BLCC-M114 TaxID=3022440 RepID=A0ABT7B4A4_9CYAN|nr:3-oxoacyl-ACP reductase family protein [Roseofilum capinflatum]MDJ1173434.1 3-oxoacyl-ACP reductase FabG [Roseofilum capinflatum BLCC-M114]
MTQINLDGKVALVTGSSRNIGRAIALELGKQGASVAINARTSAEEAQSTAQEVEALGVKAISVLADVADENQVQAMVKQVLDEFGRIDILVNNTGLRRSRPITDMTTEEWRSVLGVNLDGPFFCCRAVVPSMLATGWGRIINVSGLNAFIGRTEWSHVCASKMGALGLTRALAVELATQKITVNHIVPGLINTSLGSSTDEKTVKRIATVPQGRLGLPEEIANMCVFLASDAASFITGQTLHVNGGALRY